MKPSSGSKRQLRGRHDEFSVLSAKCSVGGNSALSTQHLALLFSLLLACAIIALALALPASADVVSDLALITRHNPVNPPAPQPPPSAVSGETNEPKLVMFGLIRVYQVFISSQSRDVCVFTPSCSRFSMAAISRYGFVRGGLMTFDRLQRCHGAAAEYYPFDAGTGKLLDPVEKECSCAP